MEIIPAIDIIDGKCVRLTEGDFNRKKVYDEHPLEVAVKFESLGFKRLHIVDLDGAKAGEIKNLKVLEEIASATKLKIDFGGGIKNLQSARRVIEAGATWCTIGSMAVKDPEELENIIQYLGVEKLIIGADVKDEKIMVSGWLEKTEINLFDFLENLLKKNLRQVFCTDIAKDGLLEGPSTQLYEKVTAKYPGLYFIASGGVSNMKDIEELKKVNCKAAIVGKAIYENRISLHELALVNKIDNSAPAA